MPLWAEVCNLVDMLIMTVMVSFIMLFILKFCLFLPTLTCMFRLSGKTSLFRLNSRALISGLLVSHGLVSCAQPGQNRDQIQAPNSSDNGQVFVGMSVNAVEDLPQCDSTQSGRVVYVVTETVFRICQPQSEGNSNWQIAPVNAENTWDKAFALYQKYREGIFRVTRRCLDTESSTFQETYGSGFYCDKATICTSAHVLQCPSGTELQAINLHRVQTGSDSIADSQENLPAPFYSFTSELTKDPRIKTHRTRDLAKLTLPEFSEDGTSLELNSIPILPISREPASTAVRTLSYILSMSFPLGFTDLYTHLGAINASTINECDTAPGGCMRDKYDFATTNNTDKGSSGSPLLSMNGLVIGMVQGGTDGNNANFTWAIDAVLLSEF